MKKLLFGTTIALIAGALWVTPASAGRFGKVKGEVVRVEQQVRTQNGAGYDRLTIRTRSGEQMQLNLGAGGACDGCFQVGDQVRAKLGSGQGADGQQVRSMQVRRDGNMFGYTSQDGTMTRSSGKGRYAEGQGDGSGSGSSDRMRQRIRQPGSGDCPGCGSGKVGGGGQRSGGGRRSGGGGGRGGQ